MSVKTSRKLWSEKEIEYLYIGHHLGAPLKTFSVVFNRTESALSKALVRLGIRQYGATPRGQKPKSRKMSIITPERLYQEISEFAKKKGYLDVSSSSRSLENPDQESSSFLLFPNPLLNFPERKKSQPMTQWLDLDCVIAMLKNRGHVLCRNTDYSQTLQGLKADFLLDGIPLTAAQLLIRANRLRIEQGLEPFYVENITEH